ncbi:MAG: hypothetical protein IID37_09505 [Planctomycetes bacterium]|nr:hypothetical protein [Planctomycetota bacterium]
MSRTRKTGGVLIGLLVGVAPWPALTALGQVCVEEKMIASDGGPGHSLGYSAAMSIDMDGDGLVALLGSPRDDTNGERSGSAYIYRDDGSGWFEEAKLMPSDGQAGDQFGTRVAISADVALIGTPIDPEFPRGDTGKAYIFRFDPDSSEWVEEATLLASDGALADVFGFAVAVEGDVAVVGARAHNHFGADDGAAYVFRFDGTQWTAEAELLASDGQANAFFATSVALSGDVIAVGAYKDGDDNSGSAYVYRYNGVEWVEEAKLKASDAAPGDLFGYAVDVRDDMLVVGAEEADTLAPDAGAAYVYRFDGLIWNEETKLTASNAGTDDDFGTAVSIGNGGDVIAVGAYGQAHHSGSTYLFRFDGNKWNEEFELVAADGEPNDSFGMDVHIIGDMVLVSANLDDNENGPRAGAVYGFTMCPNDVPCEGDVNGDSMVDPLDSGFVLARFGCLVKGDPDCEAADANGDGVVDPLDAGFVLARFGECG